MGKWSQVEKCKRQTRRPMQTRELNKNLKTNHHKTRFHIIKYLPIKKDNKKNKIKRKNLDKSDNPRMHGLRMEKSK